MHTRRSTRISSKKEFEEQSEDDCIVVNVVSSEDEQSCSTLRRSTRNCAPNNNLVVSTDASTTKRSNDIKGTDTEILLNTFKAHNYIDSGPTGLGFNTPKKISTKNPPKTPTRASTTPRRQKNQLMPCEPKTPSHIRGRIKKEIAKKMEESSSTDFSSDYSDFDPLADEISSEDEDSNDSLSSKGTELEMSPKLNKTQVKKVKMPEKMSHSCKTSTKPGEIAAYIPEYEEYFKRHSSKKCRTSENTLDSLKNPRLLADELFTLLADVKISEDHEKSINNLMVNYKMRFGKWLFILNEGFNLLLYGLGSKYDLLQSFYHEMLTEQTTLIVNGFFPSLNLKDILDSILKEILEAGHSPANPHEALALIEDEFSTLPDVHVFLIVHNLDGPMLRNEKSQTILSRLANIPNIHLLASVDNINTPLLWDHIKLRNYNFSWWDCTTMLPYTHETAFENSLLVQNSGELALSSMRSVFLSLTNNSRGIYMLIVKYQLAHKGIQNYQGMTFKELYASCRETFLVSSDLALRSQLTEFLDHKLVKLKRGLDGSELLNIPIANELLRQFLDEQEK